MADFRDLAAKFFTGTINDREEEELEALLKDPIYAEEFKQFAQDQFYLNHKLGHFDEQANWDVIEQVLKKGKKRRYTWAIRVAACLLLCVGSALAFKFLYMGVPEKPIDVVTVTLADGSHRVLDNGVGEGMVLNGKGEVIAKRSKGVIDYSGLEEKTLKSKEKPMEYNEIYVPRGKQYKVILEDGTKVVLNSDSYIRYPQRMNGHERSVYLEGEAYFDVTKDPKRPFLVHQGDLFIQVLGTRFNVRAYGEDATVETVLEEGAVSLSSSHLRQARIMRPGELAVFDKGSKHAIAIKKVDVEPYIAWKNGMLVFDNEPFEEIIRVLERRFNVEIINNYKSLGGKRFFAKFDGEPVDKVFETFKKLENFEYTIEGKTIIIYEP